MFIFGYMIAEMYDLQYIFVFEELEWLSLSGRELDEIESVWKFCYFFLS